MRWQAEVAERVAVEAEAGTGVVLQVVTRGGENAVAGARVLFVERTRARQRQREDASPRVLHECELAERVWMTNSPLADRAIDRPQVFLPLDEPVEVKEKSAVRATVMARPAEHLVAWVVEVPGSGQSRG